MSALKKVKGQPLLDRPSLEPEWWMVSMDDRRTLRVGLEYVRHSGIHDASHLAVIHDCLGELGMPQEVTREDEDAMRKLLSSLQHRKDKGAVSWMHYHMRRIGLKTEIADWERERMEAELAELKRRSIHSYGWELRKMRGLGWQIELTPEEEEGMKKALEGCRKANLGSTILEVHYLLHEFGLPQEMTAKDLKLIEHSLQTHRINRNAYNLATMLYYLNKTMKLKEPQQPDMPPLKEYVK